MSLDPANRIELRADPAELQRLLAWVRRRLEALGIEGRPAMVVELAAEELGLNAMTHGRPGEGEGSVTLTLHAEPREIRLVIEDGGPAFDPTALPAPDTAAAIEERAIGGLGVHLVRRMADAMHYERRDGRNRVVVHATRTATHADGAT